MRLILLGSGEFGLSTWRALHEHHEIAAVVSQPDRPAGRQRRLTPTPTAQWAQQAGLTVLKTNDANNPALIQQITALKPDAGIVIAFGQKLSPALIDALGRLAVNLHASLLPRYRGAAPINWAIMRGETQTGLTVISLAQRMDGGLIYGQSATPIDPLETAGQLHDRLAAMGPALMTQVLDRFTAGTLVGQPQDESRVTQAPKLRKADGTVSFDADAWDIRNRIHGLTPWPGATVIWVQHDGDHTVRRPLILRRVAAEPDLSCFIGLNPTQPPPPPGTVLEGAAVAARDGAVRLLEVQRPGGRPMSIQNFLHGHNLKPGDRFEPVVPDLD